MKACDIYSLGNALVDLEFEVTEEELQTLGLQKSLMTLINEAQHRQLIDDLDGFKHAKACGGSAANSIAAVLASLTLALPRISPFLRGAVRKDRLLYRF